MLQGRGELERKSFVGTRDRADCALHDRGRPPVRNVRPGAFRHARFAALALAAAFACGSDANSPARAQGPTPPSSSPSWAARFEQPPLAIPLVLTGSFGEHRNSHLHAGVDLGTNGVVGVPVLACLDGHIVRVRASGAGYGRSLYLQADDGRLLVYGHLDAFDEPLASYVAKQQDSTGKYEQDLWPEGKRFRVRRGQRLGWSGRSGTGSPHLHFEIRHGDMALNPLLAGLAAADPFAPELRAVTLEPLDARSFVARGQRPLTLAFGAAPDTVVLEGRARVTLEAVDPGDRRSNMAPYALGAGWREAWFETRFDSVSWATDLPLLDFCYDRGRAAPFAKTTVQLWAPKGARTRVAATNVPDSLDALVVSAAPGDPARPLRMWARDVTGKEGTRIVWVRGPRAGEAGGAARDSLARVTTLEPLPGGALRCRTAPGAVLVASGSPGGAPERRVLESGFDPSRVGPGRVAGFASWECDPNAPFESALWAARRETLEAKLPAELARLSDALALLPRRLPLRTPVTLRFEGGGVPDSLPAAGLYRDGDEGWEWLGGRAEGGAFVATTRRLGRFALLLDREAPRIVRVGAPRTRTKGAYSTWALGASLAEDGSGVDAGRTAFQVDGVRVPSEWDGVRGELRWRPLAPPAKGTHRWTLVACDRAGNERRSSGTFVLD